MFWRVQIVAAHGSDAKEYYWHVQARKKSDWPNFCGVWSISLRSIDWRWSQIESVARRGSTKTMVLVVRERRSETLVSAWRRVDGLNGLWFSLFAQSLDGLLICAISFSEKWDLWWGAFWMGFFFIFLKCGSGRIELLVRAFKLWYHMENLKSNDNLKKYKMEKGLRERWNSGG